MIKLEEVQILITSLQICYLFVSGCCFCFILFFSKTETSFLNVSFQTFVIEVLPLK